MTEVTSVNGKAGAVVIAATDVEAVPDSEVGYPGGVATLNGSGKLPEAQLPSSVVADSRGTATGDLLVFNGSSFVRFPRGAPGEQMIVGLDGTIRYQPAPGLSLDAIIDEGVTPTEALEKANEVFAPLNGGSLDFGAKEYVFKKMTLQTGVKWIAPAGPHATVIKQEAGVTEPLVQLAVGPVQNTVVDGITFVPNEQGYAMLLEALESVVTETGGLYEAVFRNCLFGRSSSPAEKVPVWLRGSPTNASLIHQFVHFKNCTFYRKNTGETANRSRCIKITGRCEKIFGDEMCIYNGSKAQEKVGTNIEIGREFSSPTALTAEGAIGATTVTVASLPTGYEAGKTVRVGEGAIAEVHKIKELTGKEVVLTSKLVFAHPIGDDVYLLAGENAPSFIGIHGTSQNCYLNALVDRALGVSFGGKSPMDMEYGTRGIRAVEESWHISANLRPLNVSEGAANGTGTATVGSNAITEATGEWTNGSVVSGAGLAGLEVTSVTGSTGALTLTLSGNVAANGTTGPQTIPLVKGGRGEGYIASLENNSLADIEYHTQGATDRTVITDATSSARVHDVTRGLALQTQTSSGLTPVLTAESNNLKIGKAREVMLASGAAIKTIFGLHAPGEDVTLRAPSTVKIEAGGNISLPNGGETVTLASEDTATFRVSSRSGTQTWILVSVQRAQEQFAWKALEGLNASLGTPAGYGEAEYAVRAGLGIVYLKGTFEASADVASSTKLFAIPTGARPEVKQLLLPAVTSTYTTITVSTTGEVVAQAAIKSGGKMSLTNLSFPLKG